MTYKSPVVAQPDYVDNAITTVAGVRDRLRDHGEPQPDLGQRWSGLGLGGFGQPGGQFASSSTVGAAANGHELVALEVDHGVSGKSLDRREGAARAHFRPQAGPGFGRTRVCPVGAAMPPH